MERFADLLGEAIHRIRWCENNKPISIIQDELGYALGRSGGTSTQPTIRPLPQNGRALRWSLSITISPLPEPTPATLRRSPASLTILRRHST